MDESDLGGFISKKKSLGEFISKKKSLGEFISKEKSLGEFISKVSQIRVIGNGKVKMTHPGLERLC